MNENNLNLIDNVQQRCIYNIENVDKCKIHQIPINKCRCNRSYKYRINNKRNICFCLVLSVILSLLAITFSSLFVGFTGLIYRINSNTVLFNSKIETTQGIYIISDERIQKVDINNTLPEFNTTSALNNVMNININNFNLTNEWIYLTGSKNITYQGLNITQLNDNLINTLHQLEKFPKSRKELNEDYDNLNSICLYRLIIELWGAVQEQQKIIESLINP
jgi:hypothetical protein